MRLSLCFFCAAMCACDAPSRQTQGANNAKPTPSVEALAAKGEEGIAGRTGGVLRRNATQALPTPTSSPKAAVTATARPVPLTRLPGLPARLVAVGDLHGDLAATRAVLKLVGAVDARGDWSGGKLVLVQTGDLLDRGDGERAMLDWFSKLQPQAVAAGGRVIVLNGNHETMNVAGDFRYVTRGGFVDFAHARLGSGKKLPGLPGYAHGRAAAFLPGGEYAQRLAQHPTVAIVGDTLFAHGGVLTKHVRYGLERINAEVAEWMRSGGEEAPPIISTPDAPVWTRLYSEPQPSASACAELKKVLKLLALKRMVVGHTIQEHGVTSACDEQIWRIDVGMSAHYRGDLIAAIEITPKGVRKLKQRKTSEE